MEKAESNVYIEIGKLFLKAFKFVLYLLVTFLELFIKLLKALFLNEYEPFRPVKEGGNNFLNRIAAKNINRYKIQYVSEHLSRHEYNFQRSDQFLAQYKYLQDKLKQIADNEINLNDDIYRDIFRRISILVSEAENKALQEGYNHARKTRYRLYDEEIYEDYIRDKVMKGEANTDWKELKERLENEES